MESLGPNPADSSQWILSSDDSPDQAVIKSELIASVKKAISKLPHDLRTAILLYEYDDLSYEEISSVLGCSVKAVEMKLYRARKLFKELLSRVDLRDQDARVEQRS